MNYRARVRQAVNYSAGELGRFNPRVLCARGARVGKRMDDDSANPRSIPFVEAIDVARSVRSALSDVLMHPERGCGHDGIPLL
jgi:hypothetical protein